MPSSVFVLFDAPSMARITPRRVHAAISAVLDLPEGVSVERAASFENLAHRPIHDAPGAKPYSLGQLTQVNDTLGMELRFLDDRLLSTLDAWLAWGGILRIGSGGSDTVALVAKEAEVVLQRSWEELAAITHNTTWEVSLVTPVVLTSRGEHVNGVTPASLATSLQQRWHKWNPQTAPPRPLHSDMARVLTTVDHTYRASVSLGIPRSDRRGRISSHNIPASQGNLRISGPAGASQTQEFSQLMALSAFTNVGSHTSYGMGVIDAVPVG